MSDIFYWFRNNWIFITKKPAAEIASQQKLKTTKEIAPDTLC